MLQEQSSRPLPSGIKDEDDDIWDFEIVNLSFEEEILGPTLVEKKDNELVIEKESLLEKMQVEEKNPRIIVGNVLVGVENLNFPIDFVNWAMEEDQQVPYIGKPFAAISLSVDCC